MKKILITGASGFIGGFLVDYGLENGYTVTAAIRKNSNITYINHPSVHLLELDFSDKELLKKQLHDFIQIHGGFDYIIHNAGVTKVQKKEEFDKVNYQATRNFIEVLIENFWTPQKFIFMSSLAAFGPGKPRTFEPISNLDIPNPINLYGLSKLKAEGYLNQLPDFPWLIIRPTGVYGPREKDYYVFFKMISRGFEAYIGNGPQYLTFIYVKDLVRCIYTAIESIHIRKSWFVAENQYYESKEFSRITKDVLQKKTFTIRVPKVLVRIIASSLEILGSWVGKYPTLNKDKYALLAADNWNCDTEALQTDLNFKASYDLKAGVEETIRWYQNEGWL